MLRPIRFIPDDTKIRFMRLSRFGFFLSGIFCTLSILAFIFIGLNYGIDFKGGTVMTIRTEQAANIDGLRNTLRALNLGAVELQEFGSDRDILIRLEAQSGGDEAQQAAVARVKEALGPQTEVRSVEVIGPKVSGELTVESITAVVLSMFGVLLYIWFRFEWQFSVGAIISLLHDVILTIGLFCVIRLQFDLQIIAAILTIIGYSLNDTVVVFDRIREFLRKYKQMSLPDLIDFSINSVLPRTLLTSVATLVALVSLYVFGGEVIRGFTFAMIWGVVIGTYSSIFIAAPVLILLAVKRDWSSTSSKSARAAARP
jgi:preprotein translocase subunit SecF